MSATLKSGSGVPPLNQENKQSRDGSATLSAPTGRKNVAQGKERSDAALGHESQDTSSPEGAKEGCQLPMGWKEVPLPEVVFFQEGPGLRSFQFRKTGIPFLNIRTFQNGRIDRSLCQFLAPEEVNRKYQHFLLNEHDIVCSTSGTIGKVATITKDDLPLMLNTSVVRFRPLDDKRLERGWIRLFLQTQYFLKQARGAATGSAQVNFGPSHIRKMSFILPPVDEQRRIVAEIEKQFTRLEAGVAALRRVQANLKRYRAAVLKAACEGKLVPTEHELSKAKGRSKKDETTSSFLVPPSSFESGEALLRRILEERRRNRKGRGQYNVPSAPETRGLATLPEGWIWTTIGACFHVAVGATPSRNEASYWGGGIPWVSSGEVRFRTIVDTRETISHQGLANSSTQLNPRGSVLLGMIGEGKTRGQTAILKIDACNNQNSAAIWVSRTPISPEYVYYWLWSQYDNTRRTSSGNNQPALNTMVLPLPPLAEQTRIVAEVERRLSVVEERWCPPTCNGQSVCVNNPAKGFHGGTGMKLPFLIHPSAFFIGMSSLRQSILQKAFTGQLLGDVESDPIKDSCGTPLPL